MILNWCVRQDLPDVAWLFLLSWIGLIRNIRWISLGLLIDLRVDVALALILYLVSNPSRHRLYHHHTCATQFLSRTHFTLVREQLLLVYDRDGVLIRVSWVVHMIRSLVILEEGALLLMLLILVRRMAVDPRPLLEYRWVVDTTIDRFQLDQIAHCRPCFLLIRKLRLQKAICTWQITAD